MSVKIEGMHDRISHLYKICKDFWEDSFIILSDAFICFFDITEEDLGKFNVNLRKSRLEIMEKLLIDGKLLSEEDITQNVVEFSDVLMRSYEYYNLPIYIKAYWLLQYTATGHGPFLHLSIMSPYCLPEEFPEVEVPGYR